MLKQRTLMENIEITILTINNIVRSFNSFIHVGNCFHYLIYPFYCDEYVVVSALFVCVGCSCFVLICHIVLCILSSPVIISLRKRKLVVLLKFYYCFCTCTCVPVFLYPFLTLPWIGLRSMLVASVIQPPPTTRARN